MRGSGEALIRIDVVRTVRTNRNLILCCIIQLSTQVYRQAAALYLAKDFRTPSNATLRSPHHQRLALYSFR